MTVHGDGLLSDQKRPSSVRSAPSRRAPAAAFLIPGASVGRASNRRAPDGCRSCGSSARPARTCRSPRVTSRRLGWTAHTPAPSGGFDVRGAVFRHLPGSPAGTSGTLRSSPPCADGGQSPIGDYGLLSDCHSAALVSSEGSVDWLCFPRFDSPAVFSRLLGEQAGHWVILDIQVRALAAPRTATASSSVRASLGAPRPHPAPRRAAPRLPVAPSSTRMWNFVLVRPPRQDDPVPADPDHLATRSR